MQKGTSNVSSGPIAPAVIGPHKDMKEVYMLSGFVLLLAGAIGAFWYYSGLDQSLASKTPADTLTGSQVTNVLKHTTPLVEPVVNRTIVPASISKTDSIHTDIYFEVGRKGLTDDAKAILATQADLAKSDPDFGILVQGYTDQQGSASYNKKLGLMRAEKVKEFLVAQGVSEEVIKVVSLGKDGVLCIDSSDICRNMNRRVHLELRKVGKDHMILPTVAEQPAVEPTQASIDRSAQPDSLLDSLVPSANASQPEDPPSTALEPASGS